MLISNADLINSCRVCRATNQDGDYECLFDNILWEELQNMSPANCFLTTPPLTDAGNMYEHLFSKLSPETFEYYPRYLCNSCGLQMKLFRKLQDKALKTLKYLEKLYGEGLLTYGKEQKIDNNDEEEFLEDQQIAGVVQSELIETNNEQDSQVQLIEARNGPEEQYIHPQTEVTQVHLIEAVNEHEEQYTRIIPETEVAQVLPQDVFIIPVVMQETDNNDEQKDHIDLGDALETHPLHEELQDDTTLSETVDLEQQCAGLDKSDYVLEIYKVLEDGTQTAVSETTTADVEEQNQDLENFEIEEEYAYSDDVYVDVDTYVIAEDNDGDFRPATKNQRGSIINSCTECSETFSSAKEFKHHRTYIHNQSYACKICSTVLKSARSLTIHMKMHSNDVPAFKCNLCPRTFTQKVHYQYHMNRHNNIRNFSCDECEKSFLNKSDLKIHQRQHTGLRPHVCEICGKGYMLSEHLRTHALKHTGVKFSCDLCSQKFASPKTLRQHVSSIHTAEPRFKCEYCLKQFRRKHHLKYHMKLHPKNVLADPNFNKTDQKSAVNMSDEDELDVDNPAEIVTEEENQNDFITDSGFVALNDDAILM